MNDQNNEVLVSSKSMSPKKNVLIKTRLITHKMRADLCKKHGVKNTGRQWTKLRKLLRLPIHKQLPIKYIESNVE